MNTSTEKRRPLLRRHPEIVGGPLVAVLLAFAYWLSGPILVIFFPVEHDEYWGIETAAGMIPYTVVLAVAVFVALTSVSALARCLSWIVFVAAWVSDFYAYFIYAMEDADAGWVGPVAETLIVVWIATPAVVFLLVCWKLPRPRFDTYLAETILLVIIAIQLGAYTPGYINGLAEPGEVPLAGILVYLGAAAYFGFAAWLVPTRRIFYGVTALAGIAIAASGVVLFSSDFEHHYVLFPIVALGIPAVGALLQITWWARGKARRTAAV